MNEMRIKVMGMNCSHCKMNVEGNLRKVNGIHDAVADVSRGEVLLKGDDIDLSSVKNSLESIGYTFVGKLA